ncbi:MAG: cell division protein FtsA [Bacteroidales bacterium]|nr:cell division protein FtsA [Bacteroidales bacterium]
MKDLIAAIDLGTTKVVAAVGKKTPQGVKVVAYAEAPSRGIKRGRVENVKLAHQALDKALAKLEPQLEGQRIKSAFVGIAGQDIKCLSPAPFQTQRKNFNELITEDEIQEITNNTYNTVLEDGYKVIFSVPQSFNVDNYMSVAEPVGMIGRNIVAKYKLFAGKENSRRMIESTLGLSHIKPIEIVMEPVASAKAVLTDDEMEVGSIMVDIGGGTTDVIVFHHNIIRYAGIIPFGGNSITEDICTGCGIAQERAEYIKTHYGCCFSDYADAGKKIMLQGVGGTSGKEIQIKTLSRIIQARMEEILEAVCWHVEQSGFKDVIRSGMVLTGGGSKMGNITNLANYVTGHEARVATPNAFSIDPTSVEAAKDATSSTAVGMLIYAFQKMEEDGVFFPDCLEDATIPVYETKKEKNESGLFGEESNDSIKETVMVEKENVNVAPKPKGGKGGFLGFGRAIKNAKKALEGTGLWDNNDEV